MDSIVAMLLLLLGGVVALAAIALAGLSWMWAVVILVGMIVGIWMLANRKHSR